MSEIAKKIIESVGCPYNVYKSNTSYEEVMSAYADAFERGKREGFTPVVVAVDDVLAETLEFSIKDGYSVDALLKTELGLGKKILEYGFEEYTIDADEDFDMDGFIGEFNEKPEVMSGNMALYDYGTGSNKETIIFEVPTTNPWELVVYVPFGGWNECPMPEEMMAICKHWYEEYKAIPVIISSDMLVMSLPAPVGKERALEVAKEHYAFSCDRVDQCTMTGTLSEVAASIAVSDTWVFWWD